MKISELDTLVKAGKIRSYKVSAGKTGENAPNQKKTGNTSISEPIGLAHIKWVLQKRGIIFHEEHRFLTKRRFRFDVALLQYRIGIEYEGLVSTGKKGGHQTKKGYTDNCVKYNLAAIDGWRMLRYTSLNYKYFETDLVNFLMNVK